jgi:hypothetical protein
VEHRGVVKEINKLIPDYMVMGERGMADMTEMEMPLPDNTVPMMGGEGPFGSVEMGGMFTMVKIRRDQKPGDYADPGWYRHPKGSVAYEWTGDMPAPVQAPDAGKPGPGMEVNVRKPGGHGH